MAFDPTTNLTSNLDVYTRFSDNKMLSDNTSEFLSRNVLDTSTRNTTFAPVSTKSTVSNTINTNNIANIAIIGSPNAQLTKKDSIRAAPTTDIEPKIDSRPQASIDQTPSYGVGVVGANPLQPVQNALQGSGSNLVLIGALVLGGVLLLKK